MISKIQKDFLLLFQCIIDFGAEVLRDFTEEKIKIKYKTENFSIFLENTRHCLYHQWEKTKVPCCQCPVHGFNIQKTGRMDKTIYDKLYSFNSSKKCPKGHFIKKDSITVQTCICRFTAENITINELDLSDLNAILVVLRAINTPMIFPPEALLINEIMIVRKTVCHALKTTKFSEQELIRLWAKFTNALYSLCPGDKKNVKWLKKTIETTKKTILSEEEVQELLGKIDMQQKDVQDISEEFKKIVIDNTADLKNCVINETAGIKAHLDSTLQPFTDKQEKHSELLIGKENRLDQAVNHIEAVARHSEKLFKVFIEHIAVLDDKKKDIVHVGTSTDNDKEEENECSSCDQKDMLIKLEKINTKLGEHNWKIRKFMLQPDLGDISDDHSDNSSGYSSSVEIGELTDEEFTDNSDYVTCPSSVRSESTPIQCYVEHSFESSLERLRLMMKEQNLDGREKIRIQIIFKEERDMQWTSDILNSFKEENNDRFCGIEFFHVSSINKG